VIGVQGLHEATVTGPKPGDKLGIVAANRDNEPAVCLASIGGLRRERSEENEYAEQNV